MASLACTSLSESILQLCVLRLITCTSSQGFSHARTRPIQILTAVVEKYIELLATTSKSHAEQCGRTDPTLHDALATLQGFGFSEHTIRDWLDDPKARQDWSLANEVEGTEELIEMAALLKGKQPTLRNDQLLSFRLMSSQEQQAFVQFLEEPEVPSSPTPEQEMVLSESEEEDEDDSDEDMNVERLSKKAKGKVRERSRSLVPKLEEEDVVETSWRSLEEIPAHIPSFLPPLPGFEKEETIRPIQVEDKETEASAKQALAKKVRTHQFTGGAHLDPWKHVMPFDKSHLVQQDMTVDMGEAERELPLAERDYESEEPVNEQRPARSSLLPYFEAHQHLSQGRPPPMYNPQGLRKRRQAAAYMSSLRMQGQDSLFGSMKPQSTRIARRTAGWLPYPLRLAPTDPDPVLHPTDPGLTILKTISTPIQSAEPLVPQVVPRVRTIYPHLLRQMANSGTTPGAANFLNRVTRLGQPGPLGPAGDSWPYLLAVVDDFDPKDLVKVQAGKSVQYGFDWQRRDHGDPDLPKPPGTKVQEPEQPVIEPPPPEPEPVVEPPLPEPEPLIDSPPPEPEPIQHDGEITMSPFSANATPIADVKIEDGVIPPVRKLTFKFGGFK